MTAQKPAFDATVGAVHRHHNYVTWEHHGGDNLATMRKGAVRAREGGSGNQNVARIDQLLQLESPR